MAQLISMVKGGYNIDDTGEFIPAKDLTPFGVLHNFPGGNAFSRNSLKEGLSDKESEIKFKANEYASRMGASFYELNIENNCTSITGTFRKMITSLNTGKIQLYVENKK